MVYKITRRRKNIKGKHTKKRLTKQRKRRQRNRRSKPRSRRRRLKKRKIQTRSKKYNRLGGTSILPEETHVNIIDHPTIKNVKEAIIKGHRLVENKIVYLVEYSYTAKDENAYVTLNGVKYTGPRSWIVDEVESRYVEVAGTAAKMP